MKKNTYKKTSQKQKNSSYHGDSQDSSLLQEHLLQVLRQSNRPLGIDELFRICHFPRRAKRHVEAALHALQDTALAIRTSSGWAAPTRMKSVEGTLSVQRAGMGFVTPATGKGPDIYIHPADLGGAWHGDTVEVLVLPGKRGPSLEGRVMRVLHRSLQEMAVHVTQESKQPHMWLCVPANPRLQILLQVDASSFSQPIAKGNLLLVIPEEELGPGLWSARITANLEHEESPAAQERLAKSNHAIPSEFPPAALKEAAAYPHDPSEAEFENRRDLQDLCLVTIDGEDARDFDDAIYVERTAKGFRLVVAIADVSHYVHQDSPLDAEARLRGNSYYFPMSVAPMLPEVLSNGLCSLRPDVPRLAMTADILFTEKGDALRAEFYPAVIKSKARLTYTQVQEFLDAGDKASASLPVFLQKMLLDADLLAHSLAAMRKKRGSLDFDLPEASISVTAEGTIKSITPREHLFSHKLIEEFMIAANEAVARFLTEKKQPALYRVHPQPDAEKLQVLIKFLEQSHLATSFPHQKSSGRKQKKQAPPPVTPSTLQAIMREVHDTPQEYTVNRLILRSMMQAKYGPENDGHFGLASSCYCHFTSPIRRYADLTVHRALKAALGMPLLPNEKPLSEARLETIATHINGTERTALEAEREVQKRLTILYLKDRVGEPFDGIVSGVTDFGIFIELPAVLSEGMISLAKLHDDFYLFIPERQELRGKRTGRTFSLGQHVSVVLESVNLGRLEVDLTLAGAEKAVQQARTRKPPVRRARTAQRKPPVKRRR